MIQWVKAGIFPGEDAQGPVEVVAIGLLIQGIKSALSRLKRESSKSATAFGHQHNS